MTSKRHDPLTANERQALRAYADMDSMGHVILRLLNGYEELERLLTASSGDSAKDYNRLWYLFELATQSFCGLHCLGEGDKIHHSSCSEMSQRIEKERVKWQK